MTKKLRQQRSESQSPVYADATGNTFLIFDYLGANLSELRWASAKNEAWCQLKKVGVDDALLLEKVGDRGGSLELIMHVIEPDQTEAEFCGNGARAVGKYLYSRYGGHYKQYLLVTKRGKHALVSDKKEIFVEMKKPKLSRKNYLLRLGGQTFSFRFVDCVEPHLVTKDFFDHGLLLQVGRQINAQWKEDFPCGVSVNCYKRIDHHTLATITFERGLYRITQACGTGSTSCLADAVQQKLIPSTGKILIKVPGGELVIRQKGDNCWLGGSVMMY